MVNIPKRSISSFETSSSETAKETGILGFLWKPEHKIQFVNVFYGQELACGTDFPPWNESAPACGGPADDHRRF